MHVHGIAATEQGLEGGVHIVIRSNGMDSEIRNDDVSIITHSLSTTPSLSPKSANEVN